MLAAVVSSLAADEIQTYSVPKEHPAVAPAAAAPAAAMAAGAADIPVNSAAIHWTVPSGWQVLAPTSIRKGNFVVPGQNGKKAEVTVTSFPGSVGTELDNVNRWRREVGLEPVEQSAMGGEPVTVDGSEGTLFDLAGSAARTVVAMISRDGASWFFKLRGDPEVVGAAKPAFAGFLKSVRFGGAGQEAAAPASTTPVVAPVAAADAAPGSPKWAAPANWTETEAGQMVFKKFSIAGAGDQKAAVSVSFFPGDVGGVFANVNRWRGQLGLTPIGSDKLGDATQTLDTPGGSATLADFTGTDSRTGRAERLVGAIVPRGNQTWFFKLMGDAPLVGQEKDNFVRFVKEIQYP
ncbi:MAG: hypothetical protein ACLQVY_30260 [Limisphaerales bacterium]